MISCGIDTHLKIHQVEIHNERRKVMWKGQIDNNRKDFYELLEKLEIMKDIYALSNNHFQGFRPATVNLFRRSAGLEPVDWTAKTGQKTLF